MGSVICHIALNTTWDSSKDRTTERNVVPSCSFSRPLEEATFALSLTTRESSSNNVDITSATFNMALSLNTTPEDIAKNEVIVESVSSSRRSSNNTTYQRDSTSQYPSISDNAMLGTTSPTSLNNKLLNVTCRITLLNNEKNKKKKTPQKKKKKKKKKK